MNFVRAFACDEQGFVISAELILVATVLVLGMLVGMSQVQNAVVSELNDVAHAIGALNQTYYFSGFHARKWFGWTKSRTVGSAFFDLADACDAWGCNIACDGAYAEGASWGCGCGGDCGFSGYSGAAAVDCSPSNVPIPAPGASCSGLVAP